MGQTSCYYAYAYFVCACTNDIDYQESFSRQRSYCTFENYNKLFPSDHDCERHGLVMAIYCNKLP